jgi:hypothetical protein
LQFKSINSVPFVKDTTYSIAASLHPHAVAKHVTGTPPAKGDSNANGAPAFFFLLNT